jgi:hypothetical protein
MIGQGYSRSQYDEFVYLRKFSNWSSLYLLVYVDDVLIASCDKSLIRELETQLSNEFDTKKLGAAKKILGMEIHRDRQARKLYLSQKKYVERILERFNMNNSKLVSTPLATQFKLYEVLCPQIGEENKHMPHVPYASAFGSLM